MGLRVLCVMIINDIEGAAFRKFWKTILEGKFVTCSPYQVYFGQYLRILKGLNIGLLPLLPPLKSGTGGVERGATSSEIGARSRKLRRVLRRGMPLIIFDFRQFPYILTFHLGIGEHLPRIFSDWRSTPGQVQWGDNLALRSIPNARLWKLWWKCLLTSKSYFSWTIYQIRSIQFVLKLLWVLCENISEIIWYSESIYPNHRCCWGVL